MPTTILQRDRRVRGAVGKVAMLSTISTIHNKGIEWFGVPEGKLPCPLLYLLQRDKMVRGTVGEIAIPSTISTTHNKGMDRVDCYIEGEVALATAILQIDSG